MRYLGKRESSTVPSWLTCILSQVKGKSSQNHIVSEYYRFKSIVLNFCITNWNVVCSVAYICNPVIETWFLLLKYYSDVKGSEPSSPGNIKCIDQNIVIYVHACDTYLTSRVKKEQKQEVIKLTPTHGKTVYLLLLPSLVQRKIKFQSVAMKVDKVLTSFPKSWILKDTQLNLWALRDLTGTPIAKLHAITDWFFFGRSSKNNGDCFKFINPKGAQFLLQVIKFTLQYFSTESRITLACDHARQKRNSQKIKFILSFTCMLVD